MAIKIDLLPSYVKDAKTFKRILAGCLLLVAATAGFLFLVNSRHAARLAVAEADKAAIEPIALEAEATQKRAQAALDAAVPVRSSVEFMAAAAKTGPQRAALIDSIRRYIFPGVVINTIDISDGKTLNITAQAKTPDDYATYLNNLRRASEGPDKFLTPAFGSGVPGYGQAGAPGSGTTPGQVADAAPPGENGTATPVAGSNPLLIKLPIAVNTTATLVNPIPLPVEPGGAAAAPAPDAEGASQ